MESKKIKEHNYYAKGMHCSSCEVLIEKKILEEFESVKSVEASTVKNSVLIEYENIKPSTEKLNQIFKKEGYTFSDSPTIPKDSSQKENNSFKPKEFFMIFGIGILIILGFIGLDKLGLSALVNVGEKSSLPMFLVFGLIAGFSSCAALVGGIILSMSKQWGQLYSDNDSDWKKTQPHLLFNLGRIISYGVFGAVLGAIGNQLNLSFKLGPIFVIAVSVMMVFLALQMFGFKAFKRFQVTMPKFATKYIADESNFQGQYMPFIMGALTFFLPCGFTITAQGLALISGSAIQGALIMFFFALGTLPMLLIIGLSSVKFYQKNHLSERFLKVAGILVLFFALYNINAQLNVLGVTSLNDVVANNNSSPEVAQSTPTPAPGISKAETPKKNQSKNETVLPPIVNGKQVIKMDATSSKYSPNYFKVKVGTPVRWEITDKGTSGCTNAIISPALFKDEIPLTPGETAIKEFTPQESGKYKFSCWMGMVSGTIEVVN